KNNLPNKKDAKSNDLSSKDIIKELEDNRKKLEEQTMTVAAKLIGKTLTEAEKEVKEYNLSIRIRNIDKSEFFVEFDRRSTRINVNMKTSKNFPYIQPFWGYDASKEWIEENTRK